MKKSGVPYAKLLAQEDFDNAVASNNREAKHNTLRAAFYIGSEPDGCLVQADP